MNRTTPKGPYAPSEFGFEIANEGSVPFPFPFPFQSAVDCALAAAQAVDCCEATKRLR